MELEIINELMGGAIERFFDFGDVRSSYTLSPATPSTRKTNDVPVAAVAVAAPDQQNRMKNDLTAVRT